VKQIEFGLSQKGKVAYGAPGTHTFIIGLDPQHDRWGRWAVQKVIMLEQAEGYHLCLFVSLSFLCSPARIEDCK
jgi:hypothetical protein